MACFFVLCVAKVAYLIIVTAFYVEYFCIGIKKHALYLSYKGV